MRRIDPSPRHANHPSERAIERKQERQSDRDEAEETRARMQQEASADHSPLRHPPAAAMSISSSGISMPRSTFYRNVVGLGVAWRRSNMRTGFHSNGNSHHDIGLIDFHGPLGETSAPGLNHLAFELETSSSIWSTATDAPSRWGSASPPCTTMRSPIPMYYKDSEGTLIEIYADTDVDWQERLVNPIKPSLDKWVPGTTPPSTRAVLHPQPPLHAP